MHNISVLIIDDDLNTIKLIAESLKDEFDVRFAITGKAGLQIAQDNPPDVILLDVKLPDIQGYEIIRRLKQNAKTYPVPVLFVSSLISVEEQEHGFKLGAVDYIAKPVEIPLLRMRVKTHAKIRLQARALEQLVATDSLTGVANRRKFDEVLETEFLRAKREQTDLAMLLIDVDNFKQYNDNYGHGKGDDCLIKICQILSRVLHRPADFLARVGGEEFAIILPDSNVNGAIKLAQDIKQGFATASIPHEFSNSVLHVSVSIGIATTRTLPLADTPKQLYEVADKALYEAKAAGRNDFAVA